MQCDKYLGLAMAMRTNDKKSTDRLEKKIDDFIPLKDVAPSVNEKSVNDNVNHPSHYATGKYECIDVMLEIFGIEAVKTFCLLNAFKYNYRSGRKNGLEDIQKAKWYIDKYIELSE
jgi:hypothetical protein